LLNRLKRRGFNRWLSSYKPLEVSENLKGLGATRCLLPGAQGFQLLETCEVSENLKGLEAARRLLPVAQGFQQFFGRLAQGGVVAQLQNHLKVGDGAAGVVFVGVGAPTI
jgi:hypothetical protein